MCANNALDINDWILDLSCSLYHYSLQNDLWNLLLKNRTIILKKENSKISKKTEKKLFFFFLNISIVVNRKLRIRILFKNNILL